MNELALALSRIGVNTSGNRPLNFSNAASGTPMFGAPLQQSIASPQMMDTATKNITDLNISNGNNFGFNIPSLQLGLQGLSALSGLYFGNKALGMAEDQFAFQKEMANKNLNNSVTAYNTGLEDRLRSRAEFAGDNSGSWQSDFERLKATK